jgi:hypothetical protein
MALLLGLSPPSSLRFTTRLSSRRRLARPREVRAASGPSRALTVLGTLLAGQESDLPSSLSHFFHFSDAPLT